MSTDRRTLDGYVRAIVENLASGEPSSYRRLRAVVGRRRATLRLDNEVVEFWFDEAENGALNVRPRADPCDGAPIPSGHTDSPTILALMRGELELSDAILGGLIDAQGTVADVTAIAVAIEIVIDAATRIPAIPALARQFHAHRLAGGITAPVRVPRRDADPIRRRELQLLERLDLLDL
jgi:hypothetical protein